MWLLLAFLAVPLLEISLFIQVGGAIGLWPTLAVVVLTAILGTWLVRSQGVLAIGRLRAAFSRLDDPTEPLADAAMILIAGALLLTPGFFTDTVGFLLLMPPVRRAAFDFLRRSVHVERFDLGPGGAQPPGRDDPDIIAGEYRDLDRPSGGSGWTRH